MEVPKLTKRGHALNEPLRGKLDKKAEKLEESPIEDICKGFNELAPVYDRFNDWITLGLHRLWKRKLIVLSKLKRGGGGQVLDLCCGTGDISLLFAKHLGPRATIFALDFSGEMLAVLKKRLDSYHNKKNWGQVKILQQDLSSLRNLEASYFELVTIAFGLRNLKNRPSALKEIWRVLKPGKTLLVLDVGKVDSSLLRPFYSFYFEKIVPRIGYLLHGQKHRMYNYLPDSARAYPHPKEICKILKNAGFVQIRYKNLLCGSAVIHIAHKA